MRFVLRLGNRGLFVLIFGVLGSIWQAIDKQSAQVLIGGLLAVAVLTFLFSIHLVIPQKAIKAGIPPAAPLPDSGGWTSAQMASASSTESSTSAATRERPASATRDPLITQTVPVRRPDTRPLRALIDLYRDRLEAILRNPSPEESGWIRLGPQIKRTFSDELRKIQPYVDDVVAKTRLGGLLQLQQDINGAALFLTTGAWCAGRAASLEEPLLKEALTGIDSGEIAVIPSAFRGALEDAIGYAHWVFVSVFHPYYASSYGAPVRGQRDGHMMDMYREFTRVAVLCYLAGVRSV